MDDLSSKLNSILSDPENMEKIRNLIGMISNGNPEDGKPEEKPKEENGKNELPFDPSMLVKVKKAMDLMNRDDPKIDLLMALKPNLSEGRQERVDQAVHMLRLFNLLPLLNEQDFLKI